MHLKNIFDMPAFNCISLRFFSQSEVLVLIGELAQKLGVSPNWDNIKKLLIDEYESQKERLKCRLRNKFVYLKMDACTRHRHHLTYFAIN